MKTYNITLLTRSGIVTVIYSSNQDLKDFEAETLQKYGTFTTISSKENLTTNNIKPCNN